MRSFSYYYKPGLFWFRISGRGILIKNINKQPMMFSERNGLYQMIRIGNILIRLL